LQERPVDQAFHERVGIDNLDASHESAWAKRDEEPPEDLIREATRDNTDSRKINSQLGRIAKEIFDDDPYLSPALSGGNRFCGLFFDGEHDIAFIIFEFTLNVVETLIFPELQGIREQILSIKADRASECCSPIWYRMIIRYHFIIFAIVVQIAYVGAQIELAVYR